MLSQIELQSFENDRGSSKGTGRCSARVNLLVCVSLDQRGAHSLTLLLIPVESVPVAMQFLRAHRMRADRVQDFRACGPAERHGSSTTRLSSSMTAREPARIDWDQRAQVAPRASVAATSACPRRSFTGTIQPSTRVPADNYLPTLQISS